jgi:hypothetical protein
MKSYGTGSVSICSSRQTVRLNLQNAQLVAEGDNRGKAEMVDEAVQWVKSHQPLKQE